MIDSIPPCDNSEILQELNSIKDKLAQLEESINSLDLSCPEPVINCNMDLEDLLNRIKKLLEESLKNIGSGGGSSNGSGDGDGDGDGNSSGFINGIPKKESSLFKAPTDSLWINDYKPNNNSHYVVEIQLPYSLRAPVIDLTINSIGEIPRKIRDIRITSFSFKGKENFNVTLTPNDMSALSDYPANIQWFNNFLMSLSCPESYSETNNQNLTAIAFDQHRTRLNTLLFCLADRVDRSWTWMDTRPTTFNYAFIYTAVRFDDEDVWYTDKYLYRDTQRMTQEKLLALNQLFESSNLYRPDFWKYASGDMKPIVALKNEVKQLVDPFEQHKVVFPHLYT